MTHCSSPNRTLPEGLYLGNVTAHFIQSFLTSDWTFSDSFMASHWYFFFKKIQKAWVGGDSSSWHRKVPLNYLAFGHIWARVSWSFPVGMEMVSQGRGGNCGGSTVPLMPCWWVSWIPYLGKATYFLPNPAEATYFGQSGTLTFRMQASKVRGLLSLHNFVYLSLRHAVQRHLFVQRP